MDFYRSNDQSERPPTIILVVLFASLTGFLYLRFLINPENIGDIVPYSFVIAAELFFILQALISFWTILVGESDPRDFRYFDVQKHMIHRNQDGGIFLKDVEVDVNVFITVYGEDLGTIRKTATAAKNMLGKHTTYILDDGKSDEVRDLAQEIGVEYIRRADNIGAKAGNVNNALQNTTSDFFVILDADHVPEPNFLFETMPFFYDDTVSYVQTPQYFENMNNFISIGSGYAQRIFYKLISRGKNKFNAAFCVGTNVVFRTTHVMEIGGIYQDSNSEDIWTSILLHEKGYKSIFISDVLAIGEAPDTTKAYVKQQQRWATGGFEILIRHNPVFRNLTLDQKLQYLASATFYLNGLANFLLFMLPSLYIYFGLIPIQSEFGLIDWALTYFPFYFLQIGVAFYFMKGFRWETMILSFVSFPIYIKALWNVITGQDEKWNVTGRKDSDSPFNYIIPHIILFVYLIITAVVAGLDLWWYRNSGILMAFIWQMVNTGIFGYFLYVVYQEYRLQGVTIKNS